MGQDEDGFAAGIVDVLLHFVLGRELAFEEPEHFID